MCVVGSGSNGKTTRNPCCEIELVMATVEWNNEESGVRLNPCHEMLAAAAAATLKYFADVWGPQGAKKRGTGCMVSS